MERAFHRIAFPLHGRHIGRKVDQDRRLSGGRYGNSPARQRAAAVDRHGFSRALNDRPDVNPETRARVKAAAARAGYVPNQSGRSLRSGRTGIVAAVIPTGRLRAEHRRRALHRARGGPTDAAAAGARPHRAVPRPGRGSAGEPAAHRAAADRRRGDHQRDDRARPAARLPQGHRRRLRRLRSQRRARRLSLRRLRLRGDGARGVRGFSSARPPPAGAGAVSGRR